MALLVYLAQRPGEVITREQLEAEVWHGMVVGYDALSNSITKLRKAFDDDRNNPRFIETIPKVGYRLIADVDHAAAVGDNSADTHPAPRRTRKLAAIIYADVAEYSRLTEADEEGTHDILSAYLDAITRAIEHHNGSVVHYAGDAMLAEFVTVVEALSCAIEVQRDLAARNAERPADQTLQFRIGINLGDVIVDRDDIYGDGVNVAARLESLADPGGVCISESVRGAIGRKLPLTYEFLGEQSVKNIAEPVRAYRVLMTPDTAPARPPAEPRKIVPAAMAFAALLIVVGTVLWLRPWQALEKLSPSTLTLPDKPSIAVLPFTNMSDDLSQEHFADGMTDDLITDLSRISGLFVIARHSVFTYKDTPVTTRQVAEDLGVRYVLAGSIRRTGELLRINAQLTDTTVGSQVWAERYEVVSEAIFDVQDRVIQSIVSALAVELTDAEQQQLAKAPTANLEAYDYYLRAERRRVTNDKYAEAVQMYLRALELDPGFSAARTGLARIAFNIWQIDAADVMPPTAARKLAYESASEALSLDPDNPDAYDVLALLQVTQREYAVAEESAQKAVALNPNKASSYIDLGIVLSISGKHREAMAAMEIAFRLDPKPTVDFHGEYGRVLFFDRQYRRAIEQLEKARGLASRYETTLAGSYVETGRIDEAKAAMAAVRQWTPFDNLTRYRVLWSHYRAKDLEHIIGALAEAGVPEWPYGYQPEVETRLTAEELRKLTSDKIWMGRGFNGDEFVRQFTGDGRVAMRDRVSLLSGSVQIRNDLLCMQFAAALLARDDCGHVYRNVDGSTRDQNEYVHVTIGDIYSFSVSE